MTSTARADALGNPASTPSAALRDVIAERARHKTVEGWTEAHDDETHPDGHLAKAAAMYAVEALPAVPVARLFKDLWPWDLKWWKPKGHRRNLVRAGALILAEIERLDRAAELKTAGSPTSSPDGEAGGTTPSGGAQTPSRSPATKRSAK